MKNTLFTLLLSFALFSFANAQNVDSFTVSIPNPIFCETVYLINHSTNYSSLEWIVEGNDIFFTQGFPSDSVVSFSPFAGGCYDIKLIIGRSTGYDTIVKTCAIKAISTIKLNGKEIDTVEVFEPYFEHGITYDTSATCPGKILYTIEGQVNIYKTGKYSLKYYFQTGFDSIRFEIGERIVYVVDLVPPTLTLIRPIDTAEIYTRYINPGYTLSDNYCDAADLIVHTIGNVDTLKIGLNKIQYWVEDCNGNFYDTITQQVYVLDQTPPVIEWSGVSFYIIDRWYTLGFNPMDTVIVTDNYDTTIQANIAGTYFSEYLKSYNIGLYYIEINAVDASGNNADSMLIWIKVYSSIEEISNSNINIYPNPNSGHFSIENKNPNQALNSISIFNQMGKEVYFKEINRSQTGSIEIDINQSPGVYFIQAKSEKGIISSKFLIK